MRVLLDSHAVIWWLRGSGLHESARRLVHDSSTDVLVSAASVWEIEVKRALGRLDVPEDLLAGMRLSGFRVLPVTGPHAVQAARLPRHHDDPFDRVLIAQAAAEGVTIVTRDRRFAQYGVPLLPA